MIPNPLYCERCDGYGYRVIDAEWEPRAEWPRGSIVPGRAARRPAQDQGALVPMQDHDATVLLDPRLHPTRAVVARQFYERAAQSPVIYSIDGTVICVKCHGL
jgi:hypothetical protein